MPDTAARKSHIEFAAQAVRDSYLLEGLDGPPTKEELEKCGSLMRRAGVLIKELSDESRRLRKEIVFQTGCDESAFDYAFFKLDKPVVNRRNGEVNQRWANESAAKGELLGFLQGLRAHLVIPPTTGSGSDCYADPYDLQKVIDVILAKYSGEPSTTTAETAQ